jgi:hypothetical protein
MAPTDKATNLQAVMDQLKKHGTDIIAVESGTEIKPVPVEVDQEAMKFICEKLEELLMAACGTTKSQMNKTDGLTRDNATIQEEVFVSYVRDPDEELVKSAFEKQLFTPLLAKLAGTTVDELPVKVVIVRQEPDKPGQGDVQYGDHQEEQFDEDGNPINMPADNMQAEGENGEGARANSAEMLKNPRQRQQALQAKKKAEIQGKARTEKGLVAAAGLDEESLELKKKEIDVQERVVKLLEGKAEKYRKPE